MVPQLVQPETLEEKIVSSAIVWTWAFWLFGALYVVGAALGYVLLMVAGLRYLGLMEGGPKRIAIPFGVVLWIIGMAAMLVALVIGHIDFELGTGKLIKSTIGWAKGWALLAVFPLAGAVLAIRPQVLYRAGSKLGVQTLILIPFFFMAAQLGLPKDLYVSPLVYIGGTGPEFFDVTIYAVDDTTGKLRWRFFGPWATATAFVFSIYFLFALFERSIAWKVATVVTAVIVCWMAGSRSAIVALPIVIAALLAISNAHRPAVLIFAAFAVTIAVLMTDHLIMAFEDSQSAFNSARAASSRVRAVLNNIGYHRWLTEAFWFGHGTVEPGPHLVQFMPIGSHHTWYGLLFVKGLVGFLALAVPLGWSLVELSLKAQRDRVARAALSIVLAIAMFSFADNLEIVTYLIWPGLLLVGIGLRRPLRNPFARCLGAGYSRGHLPASGMARAAP